MKKSIRYVIGAVVVAGVAVGAVLVSGAGDRKTSAPVWQTSPVKRGDVEYKVTASGTLSPLVTVQVGSQVSGRMKEIFVDFNSDVKKGQVLATIDPSLVEFEVLKAKAQVKTAKAGISKAEAAVFDRKQVMERTNALRDKRLATDMDADSARAAYQSALAELESARAVSTQAQAALKQAQTNLGYTTIVSPIDGVVISREIDVGQTVAASFQAPTLFQIAEDLRRMEVHTSLAESDVGQVTDGMEVEFTVDAFPSRVFKGSVKQVRYSPTTVQNVVTYDAVVSVENPDLLLRPGMTAEVSFIVARCSDCLLVSNSALRFKPPAREGKDAAGDAAKKPASSPFGFMGGPPRMRQSASTTDETEIAKKVTGTGTVFRPGADGGAQQVSFTSGITDGRVTEVVDGLAEGDLVITGISTGSVKSGPGGGRPSGN
ncbi:MAG TPA: efflux RND transporter periplasmic adaptor subunit [Myxococcota bacterium]|nr:efflux RND transporter periplasmic adaptor subunit [Myxococcota bacterium]HQP95112.1 efflux RND transporter periplasmic adaptor subunit [Myxococcota bacterium]